MNWFKSIYFLLPLLFLGGEMAFYLSFNLKPNLYPIANKYDSNMDIVMLLKKSGFNVKNILFREYQSEVELYLENTQHQNYPVILSLENDPSLQVTALQKLSKIANIKNTHIQFIDLSSPRPYATLENN